MAIVKIVDQADMADLVAKKSTFSLPAVGEMVTGTVVNVGKSKIVVDIANAAMGIISGDEALDSENTIKKISIGDEITATILAPENKDGYVVLSLRQASQGKTWQRFKDAYENRTVISVVIKEVNKGGCLVEEDALRAFLPVSQLAPEHYPRVPGGNSARILEKLSKLVGQSLQVRVLNMDESEGRMIISEKEARKEAREKILKEIQEGKILKGKVSGVVDFGIFVNYNGVEGLVHISEIDWGHVSNPADYAEVGDDMEVLVIGVDGEKISFSRKRLTPDPWLENVEKYKVKDKVHGTIHKITDYGVFVKLEETISGLVHNSELSDSEDIPNPEDVVEIGQEVEATIISIDHEKHEIGLSLRKKPRKFEKPAEDKMKDNEKEEDTDNE